MTRIGDAASGVHILDEFDDQPSPEVVTIESCHSTWEFDVRNMRFRRVLRGAGTGPPPVTNWRPYFALDHPHPDSFVVHLNREGTRLLSSWRHGPGCPCLTPAPDRRPRRPA